MERRKKSLSLGEVLRTPDWSELDPDLLQGIFERLSFTSLNRAKLVCSSWYSASRSCIPNQNQIPWLILFPPKENNSGRCMLFVPEDEEKFYRSKDFGVDLAQIYCLTTCGSWLLLLNVNDLYILNPLTGERIDLPDTQSFQSGFEFKFDRSCLWINNKTKDYLVLMTGLGKFIKKGCNNWQDLAVRWIEHAFYNDKNHELYAHDIDSKIHIWDFSGDQPRKDRIVSVPNFHIQHYQYPYLKSRMVFTVSGDFLMVSYIQVKRCKPCFFRIHKTMGDNWVQIHSLGDETLIYDMGITVVVNSSIPGIKKNSIYFSSRDDDDPNNIFVYDMTSQHLEPLPQCVFSSIQFSKARWFFPH